MESIPVSGGAMAIGANILAIIFGLAGFRLSISRGWAVFAFYTQISNLVALLSSVAFLIFGAPASWFRYLGVCMLAMTLVVTLFILVPMGGGFEELMLSDSDIFSVIPKGTTKNIPRPTSAGRVKRKPVMASFVRRERRCFMLFVLV